MSDDIGIIPVSAVGNVNFAKKPPYLIKLLDGKLTTFFFALDKPELLNGFIQAKGFFYGGASESDLSKDFSDIILKSNKEEIVEMLFPHHRVLSIKNLVFKAK